ncbi:MAG: SOS response-associated peptidase [Acidimicrobiia bacterium]|nr:SOS response-associated peptidase [Acidimicrobiia bacterium]
MCGRFVSASTADELADYFGALAPDDGLDENHPGENYNVAPTAEIFTVRATDGQRQLSTMRWGLVPFWAKDLKIGSRMINARAETVAEKPAFRKAYERRRCLIPADGFYEWAKVEGHKTKQPYYIYRPDGEPLVFAGLWERWRPKNEDGTYDEESVIETCAIITCTPNAEMSTVHDRMPLLLPPSAWDDWLSPGSDLGLVASLMEPAPDGFLELRPVSTSVNNVRNNGPHLVEPDPAPLTAPARSGESDSAGE